MRESVHCRYVQRGVREGSVVEILVVVVVGVVVKGESRRVVGG